MRYRVALRHSEEGYSVSVPALPGCWSQGDTEAEAIANIKIAIEEYLSVVEEQFHDEDVKEVEVTV
nr:type II toxin-antitoxin system HicB family antitoxin [uncultured Duganella sp.]